MADLYESYKGNELYEKWKVENRLERLEVIKIMMCCCKNAESCKIC
ncbi:TPA_asm: hypothetical protein [Altiarchaeum virus]|nr:TPA_asm: hypothetical protein [Altiarchaeum virus]